MEKTVVYGLPLNPRPLLEQLDGASFCVSYATRAKLGSQLDDAIRLVGTDGILLVDNGAFSMHKQGVSAREESYQDAYEAWAIDILDRCPQAIAVIPDVIDGTYQENAELANTTLLPADRAMPIWHMHEPIAYLLHLCEGFGYVGIGSSGQYWQPGVPSWHARMVEAFAAIDAWELESGNVRPRIHLMRAQALAHLYPVDSSDSCNVAVNHGRYRAEGPGHVARHAGRAAARIVASAGPEAAHQAARPLLDHLEAASWEAARQRLPLELAAFVPSPQRGHLDHATDVAILSQTGAIPRPAQEILMRATFDRVGTDYRPVVICPNGTHHTFGRTVFANRDKAVAFAQNWIDGYNRDLAIMEEHRSGRRRVKY